MREVLLFAICLFLSSIAVALSDSTSSMTNEKPSWEKEFAKIWREGEYHGYDTYEPIKTFIRQTLQDYKQRVLGKLPVEREKREHKDGVDELCKRALNTGFNAALKEARKAVAETE